MNYEDLTKRIEKAEKAKGLEKADHLCALVSNGWWNGYIAALREIRNDFNTGGKK